MRTHRALRLATIAFCVLMAALVAVTFVEYDTLPEVFPEPAVPALVLLVGVVALLAVLVGCVGLLAGKKWGAWLHLLATAAGTCAAAFVGHQVVSATSGVIDSLMMVSTGFIYGLAFFTDALASDEKGPKALEPTATTPPPSPTRVPPLSDF